MPGSYSVTSFCSENVGSEDSQPPAEDRQATSALPSLGYRSGNSGSACDAQVLRRLQDVGKEATKHSLSYVHSPRPTRPVRPQMVMDSWGHVLGRISCKELWLCVCLFFSQNETFYRFIYVRGIQIAAVRVHLMLIALIANPLFIDSASNNLCLVLR